MRMEAGAAEMGRLLADGWRHAMSLPCIITTGWQGVKA